jgi:8-oxo-dGTP pyrophosphatase MutT (NUDIX family)
MDVLLMTFKRQVAGWLQRFPPLRWLLALAVRLIVPRHYVGAVGAIFNDAGEVLLMEHVFRPYFPWGLPGGWVERGESPAEAVRREVKEELGLQVEVKHLLLCEVQGGHMANTTPLGLGMVYYCRLVGDSAGFDREATVRKEREILTIEWVDPVTSRYELSPLEGHGLLLAKQAFDREQNLSIGATL